MSSSQEPKSGAKNRRHQLPVIRSTPTIKCHVRSDQTINGSQNDRFQDSSVTIVAPNWVKRGLNILSQRLPKNTVLELYDRRGKQSVQPIAGELSLRLLQQMARNEEHNTSGVINGSNYGPGIDKSVILSLKDLVRQCVIVGSDWTTHYGGYSKGSRRQRQREKVFVCDLIGLQFQWDFNSGRLVVIDRQLPTGVLDDFIYQHIVGQSKPSYAEAATDRSDRFIADSGVYFDTEAYIKFVANDVLVSGLALDQLATEPINFKFLKYGTGYFGGQFRDILDKYICEEVAEGLEQLLPRQTKFKAIELPFYSLNGRIGNICQRHGIEVVFSKEDALKRTHPRYVTATTNCADPNASTGNKMGFGSIEGAIADNLEGKANKFCSTINTAISEMFLDYSYIQLDQSIFW